MTLGMITVESETFKALTFLMALEVTESFKVSEDDQNLDDFEDILDDIEKADDNGG